MSPEENKRQLLLKITCNKEASRKGNKEKTLLQYKDGAKWKLLNFLKIAVFCFLESRINWVMSVCSIHETFLSE